MYGDAALYVEDPVPIRDAISRRQHVKSITGLDGTAITFRLSYNGKGQREQLELSGREGKLRERHEYDNAGRIIRRTMFNQSGLEQSWFEILYRNGNWQETRMYTAPGALTYTIATERDATGKLLKAVYNDPDGKVLRIDRYELDDSGLLKAVRSGVMGERLYEYDELGNLIRKSVHAPGASVYGEEYGFDYDDRSLLVRMRRLPAEEISFAYTFFDGGSDS